MRLHRCSQEPLRFSGISRELQRNNSSLQEEPTLLIPWFRPPEDRFLSWLMVIFIVNLGKWCIFIFSLVLTDQNQRWFLIAAGLPPANQGWGGDMLFPLLLCLPSKRTTQVIHPGHQLFTYSLTSWEEDELRDEVNPALPNASCCLCMLGPGGRPSKWRRCLPREVG